MKFIILVFAAVVATANSFRTCPSTCTTSFYHSLFSILGTRQVNALRAPFHEIMKTEEDPQILYRKSKWTCFSVTRLDSCLKNCPSSFQKSAILSSLSHFNDYCALLRRPSKAVVNYFSCEREHLKKVQNNCQDISISYASDFNEICRILETYRKCYTSQPHNCTSDALEIKERMDESLLKTFETLLKMNANHFKIPSKCSIEPKRHRLRHFDYADEDQGEEPEKFEEDPVFNDRPLERSTISTTEQSTNIVPKMSEILRKSEEENQMEIEPQSNNSDMESDESSDSEIVIILDRPSSVRPSPRPRWLGDIPSTSTLSTTLQTEIIIHREIAPLSELEDNHSIQHVCMLTHIFFILLYFY